MKLMIYTLFITISLILPVNGNVITTNQFTNPSAVTKAFNSIDNLTTAKITTIELTTVRPVTTSNYTATASLQTNATTIVSTATPTAVTSAATSTRITSAPSPTVVTSTAAPTTVSTTKFTTASTTKRPGRKFDSLSFIGGIILATGLAALGFLVISFLRRHNRLPYSNLP